jgi:integrase
MPERLTDKLARELPAPPNGNRLYRDSDLAGFGLRVTAAGARSWVLNYSTRGRERRITIGSFPPWRERQARARAEELRRLVDAGGDPMGDRRADRAAPTMNELADRFDAEHLPKRRPGTVQDYRSLLAQHIRPALGALKVAAVRHADIERLHNKIAASTPVRANRVVAVLSKMFSLAIKWEMRSDNPAKGIERRPGQGRTRFLTPAEIARLGEVLAKHPQRASANAVRLLLLTGARRGEVLGATWDQFDLTGGVWVKPASTTKQRTLHRVPLSVPALALLAEMRAKAPSERFLFPGTGDRPLRDVKKLWASVCRQAGIERARLHDLRHTYASILASSGLSLPIIGALLGHTQAQTTARYAHLLDDPLRAATERAAEAIENAGKQKDRADESPRG